MIWHISWKHARPLKKYNFNSAWAGRISAWPARYVTDAYILVDTLNPYFVNKSLLDKIIRAPDRGWFSSFNRAPTQKRMKKLAGTDKGYVPARELGYIEMSWNEMPKRRHVVFRSRDGDITEVVNAHKYKLVKALFSRCPDFEMKLSSSKSPARIEIGGKFAALVAATDVSEIDPEDFMDVSCMEEKR